MHLKRRYGTNFFKNNNLHTYSLPFLDKIRLCNKNLTIKTIYSKNLKLFVRISVRPLLVRKIFVSFLHPIYGKNL